VTLAVVGCIGLVWDVDQGIKWAARTHHAVGAGAVLAPVATFIWAFRFNRTPPAVTAAFVKDLGGGKAAVAASHYLTGQLGFGALILFFGMLVAFAGVMPRVGCALLTLFVVAFVVLAIMGSQR
jgi:hypothetical protein